MGREIRANLCQHNSPTDTLGDTWHLDECVITIKGKRHWLWRAVDQDGFVLDVLVQSRRNTRAAGRFMRKLLSGQGCSLSVMVADKLRSYGAARKKTWIDNMQSSAAQGPEQSGRKFASAGTTTRTGHEVLQVSASCAKVHINPRPYL